MIVSVPSVDLMGNLSLPNNKLIDAIANQLTKYARAQTRLTIQILVDEKYFDDGNTKKNPSFFFTEEVQTHTTPRRSFFIFLFVITTCDTANYQQEVVTGNNNY